MKDNRLIVEFVGTTSGVDADGNSIRVFMINSGVGQLPNYRNDHLEGVFNLEDLYFDRSWDWLILALTKIKELNILHLCAPLTQAELKQGLINLDLDRTYKAVVEFIKWYNNKDLNMNQLLGQSTII